MDYFKFEITPADPAQSDILTALLSLHPFDTFEEKDGFFDAYIPAPLLTPEVEAAVADLRAQFHFAFERTLLPHQNWNELWETNFHPVVVDDFAGIRADFHPPMRQVEHELVINPKMAFGTGHHETTFLVIQTMRQLPLRDASVLDYGCGTGVLAILASRLGAASAVAVDIERESFENTLENCRANGVENVQAVCGTLADVPAGAFGVVLANINRNVILDSLPSLAERVQPGGWLVVSGFVLADKELMEKAVTAAGFSVLEIKRKNNWLAMRCRRV